MRGSGWRSGGICRSLLAALAACAVVLAVTAPKAGRFLVVEDHFDRAPMAVVLSGGPVPRSLAAAELYRQGRVNSILVIPEPPDPTEPELIRLGLVTPNERPISERILVASGVPKERIRFLPQPADGTITEAVRVRELLRGQWPDTLVLITSKFAARRARFVFRRVLRAQPVRVLCWPSRLDPFQADRWWSQPRNALMVVMEYQKFASNALTLGLGMAR